MKMNKKFDYVHASPAGYAERSGKSVGWLIYKELGAGYLSRRRQLATKAEAGKLLTDQPKWYCQKLYEKMITP